MSKIFSPEKKIVCLKDDISYKPNNCNKPMGKFSSAFLHSKFPSPSGTHFSSSLLCRCDPADSKSKQEMREVSPLLLVCSRVIRHWTIVYMHVLWL